MARDMILVVDDDDVVRDVISELLETIGWKTLRANGLDQAVDTLRKNIDRIVLVASDDHMGGYGKNGADLYFMISLDLALANIPFVLVTGRNAKREFTEAAVDFGMIVAQKPISFGALNMLLARLIGPPPKAPPASEPPDGAHEL